MELELEQTQVNGYEAVLDTTVCQEETMEMIVPDACPDILRIVDTEGWVELTSREAMEGRAELSGSVKAVVLYLPDGEEGMRRLEVSIPFVCAADSPQLNSRCKVTAVPRVESAETRSLNPRKVLVRVSLAAEVQGYAPLEETVYTGISAGEEACIEQLCETCRTYGVVCVQEKPFNFSDDVTLSSSKPQAVELLKQRLSIVCSESKVIGNKLIFKGTANLQIFYRGEDNGLCDSVFELPFSQIMEVSAAGEEADCTLEILPTVVRCTLESGGEGRTIHVNLDLLAQAVLREERSFCLLTDLYSTAYEAETEVRTLKLEHLADQGVKTPAIREVLELPCLADNVLDAYCAIGRVAQSREGDRLTLETDVHVTVLYRSDAGEIDSASRRFQVPCTLELPAGCTCICRCRCPEAVFATPASGGVEIRLPVEFCYLAVRREETSGVCNVRIDTECPRNHDSQPSIVLRMVSRGERLWDIAKCYGTTAADIRRANALEEDGQPDGQLLLIPRKRV
ncbi:DUF3794 domain-containing protein [Pseudoflavonifractor sp. 524-17]|uniref:DUF3794 and LysM peptidoglycan-binding domain-containing protein n=1 Tax=Pseudoflavonifractor sp. 524-17 TaxID=2304577 RepID=UPI00137A223F|nr:SPOCS domain-containing protein [Pseudoflavonifractor sp. 524-17]NCE64597.1 DUF3794 domain-containing protein [Pseudoflavonifractor sp. 524-17]